MRVAASHCSPPRPPSTWRRRAVRADLADTRPRLRAAMRSSAKRCQTKSSASLLFNNLASNGKHVAYVHVKESVLLPESAVISGSSASGTHIVEP